MATQKDTSESLLRMLAKTYTFGPVTDRRIAKVIAETPAEPEWPASIPLTRGRPTLEVSPNGRHRLEMGEVHGFEAAIVYDPRERLAFFRWGCRCIQSEAEARDHWRGGFSRHTNERRHHAAALIDYVAAYCKWKGWAW